MLTVEQNGDIWDNEAEHTLLCIPVNRRGFTGAGLAKEARERSIEWSRSYTAWAKSSGGRLGIHMMRDPVTGFVIASIPTKDDWRDPSTVKLVRASWLDLLQKVSMVSVRVIAVPALGCGLGGLSWLDVFGILRTGEAFYPSIHWKIYPPRKGDARTNYEEHSGVVRLDPRGAPASN